MHGKNSIYAIGLSQTNHCLSRMQLRQITSRDISLAQKYGSEEDSKSEIKVTVDLSACDIASEDGIDLIKIYGLTLIVSHDGVLKTTYFKDRVN